MEFGKRVFYDWFGSNEVLFKAINGGESDQYNALVLMASTLSQPALMPYYVCVIALYAVLEFIWRKLSKRGGAKHRLIAWFGTLCVLACACIAAEFVVHALSTLTALPRPYVLLPPGSVTMLETAKSGSFDYQSFPSVHVAFATVMFMTLFAYLSSFARFILFGLLLLVGLSQVAVGMHFPADVLYSVIIGMLVTGFVRWAVGGLLLRLKIKC